MLLIFNLSKMYFKEALKSFSRKVCQKLSQASISEVAISATSFTKIKSQQNFCLERKFQESLKRPSHLQASVVLDSPWVTPLRGVVQTLLMIRDLLTSQYLKLELAGTHLASIH